LSSFEKLVKLVCRQDGGRHLYLGIAVVSARQFFDPPLHRPDRERKLFNLETLLKDQLPQRSEVFVGHAGVVTD
jgi:hypothetical protein